MPSIFTRIKILEKKVIPKSLPKPIGFHTFWEENGKLFYIDCDGNEQKYVEKEDRSHGKDVITGFIMPKDLAITFKDPPPITNL